MYLEGHIGSAMNILWDDGVGTIHEASGAP